MKFLLLSQLGDAAKSGHGQAGAHKKIHRALNSLLLSQLGSFRRSAKMGRGRAVAQKKFQKKIQAIYNGFAPPITIQGFEAATKKLRAQEQWKTMKRTMRRAMETMRIGAGMPRRLCGRDDVIAGRTPASDLLLPRLR